MSATESKTWRYLLVRKCVVCGRSQQIVNPVLDDPSMLASVLEQECDHQQEQVPSVREQALRDLHIGRPE